MLGWFFRCVIVLVSFGFIVNAIIGIFINVQAAVGFALQNIDFGFP